MLTVKKAILYFLSASVLFVSCNDDDDEDNSSTTPNFPTEYDASTYEANTVTEQAYIADLGALASEMSRTDDSSIATNQELLSLWNSTTVKNITPQDYITVVENWFQELADASGNVYDIDNAPTGEGGMISTRLINEDGVEPEQIVEKGLFGAALYNKAAQEIETATDAVIADKLVALFGANPSFQNSGNTSTNADKGPAKYAARRSFADNGLYLEAKNHLIRAQYWLNNGVAGSDNRVSSELEGFKLAWEKSNGATIANYIYSTIDKMSGSNPTDKEKGDAIHAYGEAIAFAYGFYYVDPNQRLISNAELEQLLETLLFPINGTTTSYRILNDPVNALNEISAGLDQIQSIYGFSDQEMESFKLNLVNEEGR